MAAEEGLRACVPLARRAAELEDKLYELGVNPRKALADLAYLAEKGDPRFPDALRAWVEFRRARSELLRCVRSIVAGGP